MMDAAEFVALRASLGLSVRATAKALGVAANSVQRWSTGERRVPADVGEALRALAGAEAPAPADGELARRVADLERRVAELEAAAERRGPT